MKGEVPDQGPALIVANHASWLDIVVLGAVARAAFVAKREVAGWPLFGTIARAGRTVFVDRTRRTEAGRSRDDLAQRLAEGDMLVLFAEGTSSDGNRVLPFKTALFAAAEIEIDGRHVPVVPVSIAYHSRRGIPLDRSLRPLVAWYGDMELAPHLWKVAQIGSLEAEVRFHAPLDVRSAGGRKPLSARAEAVVRASLLEAITGRVRER